MRYTNDSILELRQTAENKWKAKYQGNYGIYTIKITTDGKKTVDFFCSCPSGAYPCKHISMIEEAIAEALLDNKKQEKRGEPDAEELIKHIPENELREFVAARAKYNPEFQDALFLEFASLLKNKKGNKYRLLIRKGLADVHVYGEDYYSECTLNIDILDLWLEKAADYVKRKNYNEAILICKACIEEYSQWLHETREDTAYLFTSDYQSMPFDILKQTLKHTGKKEMFDYCRAEMKKKKYAKTDFYDSFQDLFGDLALTLDPSAFLALQDELLSGIQDTASSEAETILRRKADFYRRLRKPDKARAIIEDNIQIKSFRLETAEKRIDEKRYPEAKKLINDFLADKTDDPYRTAEWRELLLTIAQNENDIPAVRNLAYEFIEDRFREQYYTIYKAAFSPAEWADEREKLLRRYDRKKYFSHSAADFLSAENDAGALIAYMEKHLAMDDLVRYYKVFAPAYPEKTLELFEKALVSYAEQNVGRTYYEEILAALRKMSKIPDGKKAAAALTESFKTRYKNRRAMIEVLNKFKG